MKKNCRRATIHAPHAGAFMTLQRVHVAANLISDTADAMLDVVIEQEVWLCAPCRVQAGAENSKAQARRRGVGTS
jgi:hypothetical protein